MLPENKPEWRQRTTGWFYSTEIDPRTHMRRSFGLVVPVPSSNAASWVAYLPDGGVASGLCDTLEEAMREVERRALEASAP